MRNGELERLVSKQLNTIHLHNKGGVESSKYSVIDHEHLDYLKTYPL